MDDLIVRPYRPKPEQFAWTFGGASPIDRVKPGTIMELWTEDAFGGRVRTTRDLVSEVIRLPFVNPQTGPFFAEGAEPGDTVALHLGSIEPSRDWAASATIPFFGSLTSTLWIAHIDACHCQPSGSTARDSVDL